MSIKYYVLVVLGISPQWFLEDLHGYILYSCVCLCNCLYVVTEIKFNSKSLLTGPPKQTIGGRMMKLGIGY